MKNQPIDSSITTTLYPSQPGMQEVLDFSPDVICVVDKAGRFIQVSAASLAVWGYTPGELIGRYYQELVVEEEREQTRYTAERIIKGTVVNNLLVHYRCKDGSIKPVRWSAKWNTQQEVVYCIARDGSDLQQAEKKAKEYEQQLYRACRLAQIGWWEKHYDTDRLYVSDELMTIYGLPPSARHQFNTDTFVELVHPDDRPHLLESWTAIQQQPYTQYEHRLVKPSGEVVHIIHYVQRIWNEQGKLVREYGTTKDISGRKQVELALRRSQQRLEDIVESLGDGFLALDRAWTITYWNKKIEDITGKHRAELLGRNFWDVYPKARTLQFYQAYHQAVDEGAPVHFEEYSPTHRCWLEVSVYPSPEGLSVYIKDISARKRHEEERQLWDEKLRQVRENLQHVLESMSDGFYTVDRDWTITFATDRVATMLRLNKEDYVGTNLWDSFPESTNTRFFSEYHKAFAENILVSFEEYLPTFNMWFEVNAYPKEDELAVYIKDISERKRQEKELQISNERYQFVSKATSDVIWDLNLDTGALYINQSFTKIFGYELSEHNSLDLLWNNLYPEDKERVHTSFEAALQNHKAPLWEDHYRFIKKCGDIAYVSSRAIIVRDNEGQALRMIGVVQDITERKRQERRLEFIAKATSEVIWEKAVGSEDIEINGEKFHQLSGYKGGNCIQRSFWRDKIHPEDLERIDENRQYAFQNGFDFFLQEYRFKKADGSWAYIKDRIYIIKNEKGQASGLVGAMEDITSQRLSERAIVESEKSYRQLFNNAPMPIMILDAETLRFLDVNSTAIEHYGFTREEFLQMSIKDIRSKEELPSSQQAVAQLDHSNKISLGVVTHFTKSGKKIRVECSVTRIIYKGQKANLTTINDVTEKLKLQEQLVAEKINHQKSITKAAIEAQEKERSEIGQELHDNVNQMLTTAKLFVENINYYPEQSSYFAQKSVGILQNSINEIRRLSRALVTPTIRDVGFLETLQELVAFYQELNLFEVHTAFDFNEALVSKGVKLTIYRILQEAFNNTVKYGQATLVQLTISSTAHTLRLVYGDDGVGFNPATVKMGLGLNNIHNRADAYKGTVQIRSSKGKGCTIKISFPLTERLPDNTI